MSKEGLPLWLEKCGKAGGIFRDNPVSQCQNVKPFWILMEIAMVPTCKLQLHQLPSA